MIGAINKVGEVVIKGHCHEDVMNILNSNGYATEVFTSSIECKKSYDERNHIIRIYESVGDYDETT